MKITVLTLLSLFCFFFFSCSSENEQEVNRVNSQVENTESGDLELAKEEKPAKLDLTSVEGAFKAYLRLQSEFKKKLQACTPQYANQLYLEYRKKLKSITEKLTSLESEMLDDYEGLYDNDGWLKLSGNYGKKIKNYHFNFVVL